MSRFRFFMHAADTVASEAPRGQPLIATGVDPLGDRIKLEQTATKRVAALQSRPSAFHPNPDIADCRRFRDGQAARRPAFFNSPTAKSFGSQMAA
jgi:hypothetical protein